MSISGRGGTGTRSALRTDCTIGGLGRQFLRAAQSEKGLTGVTCYSSVGFKERDRYLKWNCCGRLGNLPRKTGRFHKTSWRCLWYRNRSSKSEMAQSSNGRELHPEQKVQERGNNAVCGKRLQSQVGSQRKKEIVAGGKMEIDQEALAHICVIALQRESRERGGLGDSARPGNSRLDCKKTFREKRKGMWEQ